MDEGCDPKWGLSDLGRQQADAAGESLLATLSGSGFDPERFLVYTSPFSRTVETALQAAKHLEVGFKDKRWAKAPELAERYFGEYDLQSTTHYEAVWAEDAKNTATKPPGGGESINDVVERLKAFIDSIEKQRRGFTILLVSHGDALSILAAYLLGTDLKQHREHGLGNCAFLKIPATATTAE
jgi:broad specificity phosphatase PhoE